MGKQKTSPPPPDAVAKIAAAAVTTALLRDEAAAAATTTTEIPTTTTTKSPSKTKKQKSWVQSNNTANANATSASATNNKPQTTTTSSTTAATSSPQIVENTLKEFYEYLKSTKEKLHLQQKQDQQQQHLNNTTTIEGDPTIIHIRDNADDDTYEDSSWKLLDDDDISNDKNNTGKKSALSEAFKNNKSNNKNNNTNKREKTMVATPVKPIWTERDTKRYIQRLDQFQARLMEQIDRFPLHSQAGREILEAIQSAASRGTNMGSLLLQIDDSITKGDPHLNSCAAVMRHVSQMVIYVARLLQEIQLVDLDKLIYYMTHNKNAGDAMADKDVILLCGAARSGKTTTLHYLSGSKLEEIEVEGFLHLQPTAVKDPGMALCKTSTSDREPMTTHLQTTEVRIANHSRPVVICDTPGLGNDHASSLVAGSVELDIANGLGMVRALHRAKTIKPVFVISRDEVRVRERFTALDGETVACIARFMNKSPQVDLGPLNYVFTKYEAKHRDCLCRQFSVMRKNHSKDHGLVHSKGNQTHQYRDNHSDADDTTASASTISTIRDASKLMRKVLDDVIRKTTPKATIVLPLQEKRDDFLQKLWDECRTVNDPKRYFIPFVSFPALKKLQLQLRITLSDLRTSLVEEDQSTAVYRLSQLQKLAQVLPEAKDCAKLGVDAVKKHMTGLRSRVMASIERRDYSMAIHRAQQLVTLSEVLPEAKIYGTITHDAVVMLRDLIHALNSNDYKTCQDRMTRLTELAREFPEANKCAHFALKASIQHITEFREKVTKTVDNTLQENKDIKYFTSLLQTMRADMTNLISSEPLLLSCVNEDFVGLEKQDKRVMSILSKCTCEAFCIDQVQRLTDQLKKDVPNFKSDSLDMDDLLKKKDAFLASLERLKIISVELKESPAGARAESIYHLAFKNFHDLVSSVVSEAEDKYKATWTDLNVFGRKIWFVAVLLQGPLKNKPHTARREHAKIEELERRVLKLMLRLEIEIKRSMDRLKKFKFPECNQVLMKHTPIPDFGISELKAPRYLLISVAKNARIRKLLPSKVDVLEINVCIAMFDHALLAFWKKVVIRLEQDYAVIVAMQKVQKDPKEILQIAQLLLADIGRVEKEFLGVCGWSDDITNESESDLKRLIAVRDCVQMGVAKMEETEKSRIINRGMNIFACGNSALKNVTETPSSSSNILCRPKVAPE